MMEPSLRCAFWSRTHQTKDHKHMRFDRSRVSTQVQLIVDDLVKQNLVEVLAAQRPDLCKRIERIINNYITRYDELEDKIREFLIAHNLDEEEYGRRVRRNLSKDEELPIFGDAYDYLNEQIESFLWDADEVEEIFANKQELVAAITPHLKAMAIKKH